MQLVEVAIVILSVIGLVWCGNFIGRKYGTMGDFALLLLKRAEEQLKRINQG